MRRVVSVWFPTFPTDRLQQLGAETQKGGPFITSAHDGRRRMVAAANAPAQAVGITRGVPLASAQALVPGLVIREAELEADEAALTQLATWCLRYAPMVAADAPDGIWIDATGCTHLAGGEDALLTDLMTRFRRAGFAARAAIAEDSQRGRGRAAHRHCGGLARRGGSTAARDPRAALRDRTSGQ